MADQQTRDRVPAAGAALSVAGAALPIPPVAIGTGSAAETEAGLLAAWSGTVRMIREMGIAAGREVLARDFPRVPPDAADADLERFAEDYVTESTRRVTAGVRKALALPTRETLAREVSAATEKELARPTPDQTRLSRLALRLARVKTGDGSRENAVAQVFTNEERFARDHVSAQAQRAAGVAKQIRLEQDSPRGAVWRLGDRQNHTADCVALSGRLWSHEHLAAHHPPLHYGCGCWLQHADEAEAEGIIDPEDEAGSWAEFRRALHAGDHVHAAIEELKGRGVLADDFDPAEKRDAKGRWSKTAGAAKDLWRAGVERIKKEGAPHTAEYLGLEMRARTELPNAPQMPEGYVYNGTSDFILREGRAWNVKRPKGKPTTKAFEPFQGELGQCFQNAATPIIMYFPAPDQPKLPEGTRYVEGYAYTPHGFPPIPVHHAWLVDRNDNVQEVTWPEMGTEYVGVEVSEDRLRRMLLRKESYGILDWWEGHYPELRHDWNDPNYDDLIHEDD